MDVNAITQLISGVGFPIVCCGILFKQNSELQTTLKEISITLQSLSDRIRSIEDKVEGDKEWLHLIKFTQWSMMLLLRCMVQKH